MHEDPEKLEQWVNGLVRLQPARRAPLTLQDRVLAKLGSRQLATAARPWWSRGFNHWPIVARAAFLLASYGFVRLAFLAVTSVMTILRSENVADAVSPVATWLHVGGRALTATAWLGEWITRAIPPEWLYGAVALGAACYVVLFVVGTIAYRTLYVNK
jgi:hypothetical protein